MAYLNGKVGQLLGSFSAGQELIDLIKEQEHITGAFYGLRKLGVQATMGDILIINGKEIRIGKTGIYELEGVFIASLKFKADSADVQVDYIWQRGVE